MKRRVVSVLLALCLLAGLAACGEKAPESAGAPMTLEEEGGQAVLEGPGESSQEETPVDQEPAAGSMTIEEAIEANLRATPQLSIYTATDGSIYFNRNVNVTGFMMDAQKGECPGEYSYFGVIDDYTVPMVIAADGTGWYGNYQLFPGYKLSYILSVGDDLFGVTEDGKVAMATNGGGANDDINETVEELPEFSGAKYVFSFHGGVASVNTDGTVTFTDLKAGTSDSKWEGFTAPDWSDIAWLTMGMSGERFIAGLKNDGTVVCTDGSSPVTGWTDMVYIGCYDGIMYGLTSDGSVRAELVSDKGDFVPPCFEEMGSWSGVKVLRVASYQHGSAITFDNRLLGDAQKLVYRYVPGETELDLSVSDSQNAKGLLLENATGSDFNEVAEYLP